MTLKLKKRREFFLIVYHKNTSNDTGKHEGEVCGVCGLTEMDTLHFSDSERIKVKKGIRFMVKKNNMNGVKECKR